MFQPATAYSAPRFERVSQSRFALHVYLIVQSLLILGLIFLGGLVTSTDSGLSVPDWPTSFGTLNPPQWWTIDHVKYEHGHRLYASIIGLLTIVMTVWIHRVEPRRWVRSVAKSAMLVVILQGLLGGTTVLLKLPPAVSIAHACLGQSFLLLIVTLANATSPLWLGAAGIEKSTSEKRSFLRLATWAPAAVFIQLFLGAVVRHLHAAMAIPDFPLSLNRVIPWHALSNHLVAVHFIHRSWAYVVTLTLCLFALKAWKMAAHVKQGAILKWLSAFMVMAVLIQFTLGITLVLTMRHPIPTTFHVATGALTLAITLCACLWSHRCMCIQTRSN